MSDWERRQALMLAEYDDLLADRAHTVLAYQNDYGHLADWLARYAGRVLDVGAGQGIARHWLPASARYVALEPSDRWSRAGWERVADAFPCLGRPAPEVRGVAEALPFRAGSFDAALAIWSLNHARDPERCVHETARVLRRGGLLLLVLDDVPPRLDEVLRGTYPPLAGLRRRDAVRQHLLTAWHGHPLQPDHLRIHERDLRRWLRGRFAVRERAWRDAYLIYELERR